MAFCLRGTYITKARCLAMDLWKCKDQLYLMLSENRSGFVSSYVRIRAFNCSYRALSLCHKALSLWNDKSVHTKDTIRLSTPQTPSSIVCITLTTQYLCCAIWFMQYSNRWLIVCKNYMQEYFLILNAGPRLHCPTKTCAILFHGCSAAYKSPLV